MNEIQGLPALFVDNLQKILRKWFLQDMKFYTITHCIKSSTARKIFTKNCQNTSLKYKKEFKQIYSCIIFSKRCKKLFKLQKKFIEHMLIPDEKPIQSLYQLNTSNICQNLGNSLSMK